MYGKIWKSPDTAIDTPTKNAVIWESTTDPYEVKLKTTAGNVYVLNQSYGTAAAYISTTDGDFTTGDNIQQIYATDAVATGTTDGYSSTVQATAGNGSGTIRAYFGLGQAATAADLTELYGAAFYAIQNDGSKVRNNMYAVMGYMEIEETGVDDDPIGYIAGVVGVYDTNGIDPTVSLTAPGFKAAIAGIVKDNANTKPHAAVMAYLEGDATATACAAAFKAVSARSAAGGAFTYGLDLINSDSATATIVTADIRLSNGMTIFNDKADRTMIGSRIGICEDASPADNAPANGVVLYFDGTDLKAKNSAGATATLNNAAFA